MIQMTFVKFNTESNFDYVTVYDGVNSSGVFLGTFSGDTLPGDIFSDSSLFVSFQTSVLHKRSCFEITYSTLDSASGKRRRIQA